MQRTIVKAAIKYKDKIYTGFDHGECFIQMPSGHKGSEDVEQGFITDDGRFVDRKEAMKIARNAGQLIYDLGKETLISEDLHLYWLNQQEKRIVELQTKYDNLHTALSRIREIVPETVKILLSRIDEE